MQEQCNANAGLAGQPDLATSIGKPLTGISWLNKQNVCPDPQIISFEPASGPVEGGTQLTITGVNLGN